MLIDPDNIGFCQSHIAWKISSAMNASHNLANVPGLRRKLDGFSTFSFQVYRDRAGAQCQGRIFTFENRDIKILFPKVRKTFFKTFVENYAYRDGDILLKDVRKPIGTRSAISA